MQSLSIPSSMLAPLMNDHVISQEAGVLNSCRRIFRAAPVNSLCLSVVCHISFDRNQFGN